MSENCNHDCSSCGESCKDRDPKSMLQAPHEMSSIKMIFAVSQAARAAWENPVVTFPAGFFHAEERDTIPQSLMRISQAPPSPKPSASMKKHTPTKWGLSL